MLKRAGMLLLLSAFEALAADAPPEINACALLDPAQIESVIGQAVEPGSRRDAGLESNGAWSSSCLWLLASEHGKPSDPAAPLRGRSFVILNAMQWPVGSGRAHEFLDTFYEAAEAGVISEPSPRQIGDEALWWGDGLAVRQGDVSFGLSLHLPAAVSSPRRGMWEERLAPVVLAQLGR